MPPSPFSPELRCCCRRSLLALAVLSVQGLLPLGSGIADDSRPASPRTLPRLCKDCLAEPLEVDHFGGEALRVNAKTMSQAEFHKLALSGRVLIIENASSDGAMAGWTCDRFAQEFPEAKMRREYDWVTNPEDRNLQKLGDAKWTEALVAGEDSADRLKQDSAAPPFAPFYWGVREHRGGDVGSRKVIDKVKGLIANSVPSFMEKTENGESMFENSEFWLGAKGTGARAHMDSHCISTLSFVLSGERRWRIGPVPRMPAGAGRSRKEEVVFDDGVAYKLNWKPMFEFTVKEGEAVLFPPGWIHESLNLAETCTVALTTQFTNPRPVRYWRSYYQRLRRVGDLNPCWNEMIQYGSLGLKQKWAKMPAAQARSFAEIHFGNHIANKTLPVHVKAFYDLDDDGEVSMAEFVETFTEWVATEKAIRKEKQVRMPSLDISLSAAEASRGSSEL